MELVLGIDLGTSYFKLGVFDRDGKIRGLGRVFVPKETSGDGRCELAVEKFWSLLKEGLTDALQQAKAKAEDICSVGYSSQANSFILLDKNDAAISPFILWPDTRAKNIDARIQNLWNRDDFLEITGLGMTSLEHAVVKIFHLRENQPQLFAKAAHILNISDYLVFSLTGNLIGDSGTAALLGLLDLRENKWWKEALESLGLSASQFAKHSPAGTVAGGITSEGAKHLELEPGTAVVIGSLDHHVAAIGAGIGTVAEVSESIGTVLACLSYTDSYTPRADCCIGPQEHKEKWYQLTFSSNGAAVLEWYQKNFAAEYSIDELIRMAEKEPAGSNGLVALPQANLYENLSGFVGAANKHGTGCFTRAILESVAATSVGLIETLCPRQQPKAIVATGGGARSNLWLQIKTDLLNTEIITTNCDEPACMGAAILASPAAGWFKRPAEAAREWISIRQRFTPDAQQHRFYLDWYENYRRICLKHASRRP